ncbi:hypothetical protein ACFVIM_11765 [Streptomyces sp. NPDC057638]|uniref:hypothetical protein n=1 Tax=Streptomyces sp. NPDC057638 TaxID=3346190 RepID=UPI0036CAA7F4
MTERAGGPVRARRGRSAGWPEHTPHAAIGNPAAPTPQRLLVLSGVPFSGRRTAALMLLHVLKVTSVRALVRDTARTDLARIGAEDGVRAEHGGAPGYLLCDLLTRRHEPLREAHLLAARNQLAQLREAAAFANVLIQHTGSGEEGDPVARPPR